MASSFESRLREGPPIVADGGLGVVLSAAVPGLRAPEEANLRAPDAVTAVHVSFINAGADLIETNYDLDELAEAIAAVKSVSALPIVALLSFDSDAVTMAGVTARAAAERLRGLDVAAFGANHGRGPAAALTALAEMSGDDAVLAALPNVGLATMTGSRISFPHATPEYFGDFAASARSLGARLIGGCCGTTPAQIAAIRQAVDENRPARVTSPARGQDAAA